MVRMTAERTSRDDLLSVAMSEFDSGMWTSVANRHWRFRIQMQVRELDERCHLSSHHDEAAPTAASPDSSRGVCSRRSRRPVLGVFDIRRLAGPPRMGGGLRRGGSARPGMAVGGTHRQDAGGYGRAE